jgi:hypothetical protein
MTEKERRPNVFSLLLGLVDRPASTLTEIATHPRWRWILPVLLLVVATIAATVLTSPLTWEQTQKVVQQQLAGLPEEQAELARAQIERLQTPGFMMGMSLATGLLGVVLAWLVAAAILYFSMLITGGDVEFSGLFATMPWIWLPFALRDVAMTGWTMYRGRLVANPGLSYFASTGVPTEDATNLLYNVLSHADLFVVWHLVLVFVLAYALPKFGRGKAFVLTVIYAAVNLGLRLLPVVLGGSLMGGLA